MTIAKGNFVEQNLGLWDRVFRVVLGCVMLAVPYYLLTQAGVTSERWHSLLIIFSVYPFLSGILGADPLYRVFRVKCCDLSSRNRCGSFPFQVDAFLGRHPIPEDDYEHTLSNSHHERHA
ncbi:MAG: DUF2892 domain-containing protein [Gammaproteobacteria bacterium]|nr:DUF2892 domain-containing protein [Gammaproteobacteria bacterium]